MRRIGVLIAVCGLLIGCQNNGEDEPPVREPDYVRMENGLSTFEAPAEGADLTIRFSTNTDWTVEHDRYSEGYVASLLQESGVSGDHEITIAVSPNVGVSAESRSYKFSIRAGLASAEITIMQEPMKILLPEEGEVRAYLMRLYNDAGLSDCRWASKWGSDLPINDWGTDATLPLTL